MNPARARIVLQLLEELPDGISIHKHGAPRVIPCFPDAFDGPAYQAWLRELDEVLRPSQEDQSYDFKDLPEPPSFKVPEAPVWEVSYYDEYGEVFDETHVTLAESRDLVHALLQAKNRLSSKRMLRGR